jgi:hypothetical protein
MNINNIDEETIKLQLDELNREKIESTAISDQNNLTEEHRFELGMQDRKIKHERTKMSFGGWVLVVCGTFLFAVHVIPFYLQLSQGTDVYLDKDLITPVISLITTVTALIIGWIFGKEAK